MAKQSSLNDNKEDDVEYGVLLPRSDIISIIGLGFNGKKQAKVYANRVNGTVVTRIIRYTEWQQWPA